MIEEKIRNDVAYGALMGDLKSPMDKAKTFGMVLLIFAYLISATLAFLDFTYNMRGEAFSATLMWPFVMAVLSIPLLFSMFLSRLQMPAAIIGVLVYFTFGFFPESTFLPFIAVPIVGAYSEDSMPMGNVTGFFEHGFNSVYGQRFIWFKITMVLGLVICLTKWFQSRALRKTSLAVKK